MKLLMGPYRVILAARRCCKNFRILEGDKKDKTLNMNEVHRTESFHVYGFVKQSFWDCAMEIKTGK